MVDRSLSEWRRQGRQARTGWKGSFTAANVRAVDTDGVNERLFDGINGLAGRWSVLDDVAKFLANDAIFVLGALIAIFGVTELVRDGRRGVMVGAAGALALLVAGALAIAAGSLVTESRPFVGDADSIQLIRHGADNAFPSDHATVAAAAAVVAAMAWRRWAVAFIALAALIGIARVFVGVHLPGDVAVGWLLGTAAALAAWRLAVSAASRWRILPTPEHAAPAAGIAGPGEGQA